MVLVLVLALVVCGHEAQEVLDDLVTAFPERRVVPRPETAHCRGCAQGFHAPCRARVVQTRRGSGQPLLPR
jgi:hypothetical protein